MGLNDFKCDSCGREVGFLFPIAVIQELSTGGECMVVRYFCKECYDTMLDAAEEEILDKEKEKKEEDEDEEEEEDENEDEDLNKTDCECCKHF